MAEDEITMATLPPIKEKIDIMVPAHGNLEMTIACVKDIFRNTQAPFHLIVCDDSDPLTDATPSHFERFCKAHDNVTYIHRDTYVCGNAFFNDAIKNMQTKYLATIMNSVRVYPDWERVGVHFMNSHPDVGVIGFKCLFPDTLKIECAGIQLYDGYMPVDIGRDLPGHHLTTIYEVQAIQWAFALLRKEAVEGNLDETIFHGHKGWDDIDNCFVVRKKGWKIYYCGYGIGMHHPRATRGDNSIDGYLKNRENAHRFYKRWGLWNNYMGSKKMDVGEQIPEDMKANLRAVTGEWQMLQSMIQQAQVLAESRRRVMQDLTGQTLKLLGVDPTKYVLGVDPGRDMWDLKLKLETEKPSGGDGEIPPGDKDALDKEFKARQEAMKAKAIEAKPDAVVTPGGVKV